MTYRDAAAVVFSTFSLDLRGAVVGEANFDGVAKDSRHCVKARVVPNLGHTGEIQGVQDFFSQFTATPSSPTLMKETFKAFNEMRLCSHSYCWLEFFVQPIAAVANFPEFLEKNTIFLEHPVSSNDSRMDEIFLCELGGEFRM